MWAQIVNILIGLFLMFSPTLWSYDKAASDHHYILGPLVITTGIIAIWEVNRGFRWMNVLFGAWLLISPFILGSRGINAETDVFAGILLIIFSMVKGSVTQNYGGGWTSLFHKNPAHWQEAKQKE
jgi:glucose dehydrogenase